MPEPDFLSPEWRAREHDRYQHVDQLMRRGSCRCTECGRGVGNHSITICRQCERKIARELEAMGWGDWLRGGPAPIAEKA